MLALIIYMLYIHVFMKRIKIIIIIIIIIICSIVKNMEVVYKMYIVIPVLS